MQPKIHTCMTARRYREVVSLRWSAFVETTGSALCLGIVAGHLAVRDAVAEAAADQIAARVSGDHMTWPVFVACVGVWAALMAVIHLAHAAQIVRGEA